MNFQEFLEDTSNDLNEALITFARQAYPKFGNVLIMAGGAGSGKGFIKDKLVGLEGYNFDVDELKKLAVFAPSVIKRVKKELGFDLKKMQTTDDQKPLRDPENVSKLHEIIGDHLKLDNRKLEALYTSILTAHPDRKPNLVFDMTLSKLKKFKDFASRVQSLGYSKDKIHIVWIVQDVKVAVGLNNKRDRVVPIEILVDTHIGANKTMSSIILSMGDDLAKYMDGDIVLAFNKIGVDSKVNESPIEPTKGTVLPNRKVKPGMVFKEASYVYVKRAGQQINQAKITKDMRAKLSQYVPSEMLAGWEIGRRHKSNWGS